MIDDPGGGAKQEGGWRDGVTEEAIVAYAVE
jgi:hypothetical protein